MKTPGALYLIAAGTLAAAAYVWWANGGVPDPMQNPDDSIDPLAPLGDAMDEATATVWNMISPNPAASMQPSDALVSRLKQSEGLRLTRYNLGDGGWTIGYGHYSTNLADIPATCTQAQADAWFASDLQAKAVKWVQLYVSVPLTQNQFDALVDVAFNLSPRGFKRFADAVNAGQGIDDIAQASVSWVSPALQNGIQNRRNSEMAMFDNGDYTA
ncbi:lysozyme [Caballeronia temeraria]|uniref:Lysozyme n=1 Tax=Caballeronia temeraria TaxID=1777137 RepID=A0A158BDW6_9BURK|nr:lysozyme [Caballeronia temeraria]SAK68275.1 lysozyme [Caballeronia temeraria]